MFNSEPILCELCSQPVDKTFLSSEETILCPDCRRELYGGADESGPIGPIGPQGEPGVVSEKPLTDIIDKSPVKVLVTALKLNVRRSPHKDSPVVRVLSKGDIYDIIEEQDSWGKLTDNEWINLFYVEKLKS